jgi:hypothetical protein
MDIIIRILKVPHGGPGSIPGKIAWNLWWKNGIWAAFLRLLRFPLQIYINVLSSTLYSPDTDSVVIWSTILRFQCWHVIVAYKIGFTIYIVFIQYTWIRAVILFETISFGSQKCPFLYSVSIY